MNLFIQLFTIWLFHMYRAFGTIKRSKISYVLHQDDYNASRDTTSRMAVGRYQIKGTRPVDRFYWF